MYQKKQKDVGPIHVGGYTYIRIYICTGQTGFKKLPNGGLYKPCMHGKTFEKFIYK